MKFLSYIAAGVTIVTCMSAVHAVAQGNAKKHVPSCSFSKVQKTSAKTGWVSLRLKFSERVALVSKHALSVRKGKVISVKAVHPIFNKASTFTIRVRQSMANTQASIRLSKGKTIGARSRRRNAGCGPYNFSFEQQISRTVPQPAQPVGEYVPPMSGGLVVLTPYATLDPVAPAGASATPTKKATATPKKTATKKPTPVKTVKSAPVPTVSFDPNAPAECTGSSVNETSSLPVFPGAEGFGSRTTAGSGRNFDSPCSAIYRVTNLRDSGPGSLRSCFEGKGPRTCIFEVSGVIWATNEMKVTNPFLTVAGQTAPSPGIIIRGSGIAVEASNVLLQHLQVRVGDDPRASCCKTGTCGSLEAQFCTQDPGSRDGVKARASNGAVENVVFDHLSITWALDEGFSLVPDQGDISNVTFSNSIIGSGLDMSIHPEANTPGDLGHSKAVLVNGAKAVKNFSFHKNLLAHNADRNIRITGPMSMEFLNNIVYDWGRGGGQGHTVELTNKVRAVHEIDMIGNQYIAGPETFCPEMSYQPSRCFETNSDGIDSALDRLKMHSLLRVGNGISSGLNALSRYFLSDNYGPTRLSPAIDEWAVADRTFYANSASSSMIYPQNRSANRVADSGTVTLLSTGEAYSTIVRSVGARPRVRDSVDVNILEDLRLRSGQIINCVGADGSERCQKNAGGWPLYPSNIRPLTPPASPNSDSDGNGYTDLEDWLNAMAAEVQ